MSSKTKKDVKAKVGKNLDVKKHETATKAKTDVSNLPKIFIEPKLELEITNMIKRHYETKKFAVTKISHRLTKRKLTEFYDSLSEAGFKKESIELCMKFCIPIGGNLVSALDWLCLNTKDEDLPDNFSQVLKKEEKKTRPKFIGNESEQGRGNMGKSMSKNNVTPKLTTSENKSSNLSKRKNESSVKNWILQYADATGNQDDDDDDGYDHYGCGAADDDDDDNRRDDSDTGTKSKGVNESFLKMVAMFFDLRSQFSPDNDDDQDTDRLNKCRNLANELWKLQSKPGFDSRNCELINTNKELAKIMKIINCKKKSVKKLTDDGDNEDDDVDEGVMNLFGDDDDGGGGNNDVNKDPTINTAAPSAQQTKEARKVPDVRDFTYTRQQWTGKSPKQFLNDWYRKRVPKGQVTYEKIDLGGGKWKSRCHLKRPPKEGGDVVVCPEIACTNLKDAEHLASVLLLHQLCSNKDLHLLLPPPYRDVWLEWQRNEREQVQKIKQEDKKPRDDFIEKFFSQLSKSSAGGVCTSNKDGGDVERNAADDGGAEDGGDWENWTAEENDALDAEKLNKSHHHQPLNRNFSDLIKRSIDIKTKNETNKSYAILKKDRESLPVYNYRQKIIDTFRNYDVFIVAGETGSGKSTQVPQFILEELLSSSSSSSSPSSPPPPTIICTEPRRISAVSLARRVCAEMGEVDGPGSFGSLCGYQIRSEVKRSRDTRLLFCTTGVLLRRLQEDLCVEDVGCVIVDEVHERDLNTDVLLIHLLEMLTSNKRRSKLKVVLMSATMDSDKFHKYFKGCPVVRVEGRSFPVQVLHLEDIIERTGYQLEIDSTYALPYEYLVQEQTTKVKVTDKYGASKTLEVLWSKDDIHKLDWSSLDPNQFSLRTRNTVTRLNCDVINVDLILETVRWLNGPKNNKNNINNNDDGICGKEGAVLVFLPGMAAIEEVKDSMLSDPLFGDPDRFLVLPLHSILSSSDQSLAFNPAKCGVRKVILSTNIAETGVTIPDVVYVVDCGWEKQMRYLDSHRISQLRQIWISKASARQRQGRAGRVREGVCVRLYTSGQFDVMSQHSTPEIKRVPLQGLCLHVMKSYSEPPNGFLSKAIDPPDPQAINVAMSILREAGACEGLSLTPLGHHLARLPLDAKLGKMMVYAGVLGCLQEASIMVACMTEKSPFISRLESSASSPSASDCQGKARFNSEDSDQLAVYTAVREWMELSKRTERRDYCRKYGLKMEVLQDIESTSRELRQLIRDSNLETNITDLCTDHPSLTKYLQPRTSLLQSKVTVTLLKAVLMAGLYPQIGRLQTVDRNFGGKKRGLGREVNLAGGVQALIHPGSVNRKLDADGWIVYQDKEKLSQQIALRDTTLVSSVAVLLFAGDIEVQHQQHLLTVESVEDLIAFKAPAKIGVLMKEMRSMLDDFLRRKLHDPKLSVAGEAVLPALIHLLISGQ